MAGKKRQGTSTIRKAARRPRSDPREREAWVSWPWRSQKIFAVAFFPRTGRTVYRNEQLRKHARGKRRGQFVIERVNIKFFRNLYGDNCIYTHTLCILYEG